ncbi:ABC transporter permease [Rhodococcoides yunnanense]|uniref:ABC transporter permease n=1 Tax=Rhodococcoides yunnanense TaxID=278209 RepID=UPI0009322014|nr:ABC transporter permease [Rhodococcus yunnanensis]
MSRYIFRRTRHAILVLWAAFTVAFAVLFVVPGDPVTMGLGTEQLQSLTPEQVDELRAQAGTDRPFVVQYFSQLWNALHGDLGHSYRNGVSVTQTLADAAPSTLQLAASALILGIVLGIALAVFATLTRSDWLREILVALPPLGVSVPSFWIGLVLLQVFSFQLGWFPAFGERGLSGLVLPAVTLSIPVAAITSQVLIKSLRTTIAEPYADVLRAKGVGRFRLFFRHALRNASLPALTTVGVTVATLLGGSVLTETVFSRNGLGQIAATAVGQKDIPVVMGVVLISAVVFVVVSLIIDLLYSVLDPRVRIEGATA